LWNSAGGGQDFFREFEGDVVFADDDFHVEAEVAGAAQDFGHPALGQAAAGAGVVGDFYIDHGAVQFLGGDLARAARRALGAAGDDDVAQDALFVGIHEVVIAAAVEAADDGGVSAPVDADNTALHAPAAATPALHQLSADAVAVHGLADSAGRDEDVALDAGDGFVGDDEAVAVAVGDQAAADVASACLACFRTGGPALLLLGLLTPRRHVAAALDGGHLATFLKALEGFLQGLVRSTAGAEPPRQFLFAEGVVGFRECVENVSVIHSRGLTCPTHFIHYSRCGGDCRAAAGREAYRAPRRMISLYSAWVRGETAMGRKNLKSFIPLSFRLAFNSARGTGRLNFLTGAISTTRFLSFSSGFWYGALRTRSSQ
jgi:hypothetical protein